MGIQLIIGFLNLFKSSLGQNSENVGARVEMQNKNWSKESKEISIKFKSNSD